MKTIVQIIESINSERAETAIKHFKECSVKYFSDMPMPKPVPKITVGTASHKYGHYSYRKNEIWLNVPLFNNEWGLKSTVYHETIHFFDKPMNKKEFENTNGGHGEFFKERMKKINSGEGEELVEIGGTLRKKYKELAKPIHVYGAELKPNKMYSVWMKKPTADVLAKINDALSKRNIDTYYYLETSDPEFMTGDPLVASKTSWGWSFADEESSDTLKREGTEHTVERVTKTTEEFIVVAGKGSQGRWLYSWIPKKNMEQAYERARLLSTLYHAYDTVWLETNSMQFKVDVQFNKNTMKLAYASDTDLVRELEQHGKKYSIKQGSEKNSGVVFT